MTVRRIAFGASMVALDVRGARAAVVADFLFGRLPPADGVPHVTLTIGSDDYGLWLRGDEEPDYRSTSDAEMADYVLGRVCYHLADRSRDGLMFHAAALERNGRGLIVPGTSGAGKSTLTAWLSGIGFTYLTDELVFVPEGASRFSPLARPLNLKRSAHSSLPDLFADPRGFLAGDTAALVPPERFGMPARSELIPLSALLFVRFAEGASFEWTRLSAAQSGLALMQCLINARNLPEHGFPETARLCRSTPAYRLVYGSFAELEPHLPDLYTALDAA
jgi:hypothetical protein